jgi:hypothetical protein
MAIVLGKAPKSFKEQVHFIAVTGVQEFVEFEFKYRTKAEFGEFVDNMVKKAGEAAAKEAEANAKALKSKAKAETTQSLKSYFETEDANDAAYMLECAIGWDLAEPFNLANVQMLIAEHPNIVKAFTDKYTEIITKGRTKN